MADNKKYYYLKLKENFFESDTMLLLEGMKDGYIYSNILLKLYLKSLKDDGRLILNGRIPYSSQMIANVTRHKVGTVERALKTFEEFGLIEIMDNGAIYMLDIQNFIGESSSEADRKREYRARIEKEKMSGQEEAHLCGQMSEQKGRQNSPEKEIEIKTDISIICPESEKLPPDPSDILLPLMDKTTYNVPVSKMKIWADAYPAVDVKQELRKMIAWLESNPKRKKTRRGITRFIDSWLAREQDKGGRYRNHVENVPKRQSAHEAEDFDVPHCQDGPF